MTVTQQPTSTIDALAAQHGDVQVIPASFAQRRFFVLDQLEGGAAAYTIPVALRLNGPLHVPALEQALNAVVGRHESLRTVFAIEADDVVQVVLPALHVPLVLEDHRTASCEIREATVMARAADNANATFDLSAGPLLRATLLQVADDEHVLLLTMHHIIGDGWSMGVMFDELERAYAAFLAGSEPDLPALPLQYPDFAVWQQRSATGSAGQRQTAYWTERLKNLPTLDLATDHPRPPVQSAHGDKREMLISAELAEAVRALARREGATPYVAFLAAWVALLHRYTTQADVIVGSITSGRRRAEVESLIGPFVNTLAIRTDLTGDPSFSQLLGRVRESSSEALVNQDVPFEQVVDAVQPARDRSRSPVFQVAFQLLDGLARDLNLAGVRATRVVGTKTTTKFELTLILNSGADGALRALMEYNTDLFDAETADRMLAHYATLLEGIVRDATMPVSRLPMLVAAERVAVTTQWNETAEPLPAWSVPFRVLEQAQATPDAVAARAGAETLSYGELARRSAIVARALVNAGVRRGERVAIAVNRTTSLPVAMLAVLRVGAAYVPIDTSYPAERIAHVLDDAGVRVVLTDAESSAGLPAVDVPVITLGDDLWQASVDATAVFTSSAVQPDALAYVLYTSGSTGKPKGVMVPHRALANFLASMSVRPGLASGDAIVAVTTISFDIAGLELWLPLVTGATVVIASRETAIDGVALRALLERTARDVGTGHAVLQATPATWRLLLEAGWNGTPNVVMLCGGEAWPAGLAESLVRRGAAVWNMYGPTETTIWSSVARVTDANLSLGQPIANTTLLVLEPSGEPAPIGVPGELWIGGAGLADGYHNRPDLTAEKFVEHAEFGRIYRTGDRVRRLGDGGLVYQGRLDDQVKVRGYRIELGDIEHALSASPAVGQAVATVHRSADGADARIVAYVVLADVNADEVAVLADLGERVRRALPEYMVPSLIVRLYAMPLTPNGKVDRRALPEPTGTDARATRPFVASRSPLEQQIAAVWAAVLRVEHVSVEDDFFSLGGHSLAAMRVIARLADALPVRLTIGAMFDARTVAGLAILVAQRLADAEAGGHVAMDRIVPRELDGPAPLTHAQELLWLYEQMTPGTSAYNVPMARRVRGPLDMAALHRAFDTLVERHESLRTAFLEIDGTPRQVVNAARPIRIELHDLRAHAVAARGVEADALLREAATRSFDLTQGTTPRVVVVQCADDDAFLLIVVHHIVFDGGSVTVLFRELAVAYEAALANGAAHLPALPIQLADYATWERRELDDARLAPALAFWRTYLDGAPSGIELPTDFARSPAPLGPGARYAITLGNDTRDVVRSLATANDATSFMVLLAAFQALLHRYSGQRDLVVGTAVAGRTRPGTEGIVGYLANTLALRTRIADDTTFADLLREARASVVQTFDHQDVSYERLVHELRAGRPANEQALFGVMFTLQDESGSTGQLGEATLESVGGVELASAKFDLTVSATESSLGIRVVVEYRSDFFAGDTIERMVGHLRELLHDAERAPKMPVSRLSILPAAEQRKLLVEWNDTAVSYPERETLVSLMAAQVARTPDAIAIEDDVRSLTFAEFDARARSLAWRLRGCGVDRDVLVAVCAERSVELVVALAAILMAGGAYVPLDPDYPAERLAFMLEDAAAPVVLAQRRVAGALPAGTAMLWLDDLADLSDADSATSPLPDVSPDDLAYMIFTSGSTGRPKGALNAHRGIVNRLLWMQGEYQLAKDDVVMQKTPFSFDVSVWEFFWPLIAGARLVMARPGGHRDTTYLAETLSTRAVTVCHFVPSMLRAFLADPAAPACTALRDVLASGEALSPDLVALFHRTLPGARLHNLYGPTECAVDVSYWPCPPAPPTVPIGRPIANTQLYVLDAQGEPAPIGVPGELHIGGVQVGLGYHRRPELTAEKFIVNRFAPGAARAARLYRTGDRARWRADGTIEYLGRLDFQVKLRGFRIELGEIEATIAMQTGVRAVVVDVRANAASEQTLVAYVVPETGVLLFPQEIRTALRGRLPEYMVPAVVMLLDALPTTSNGKTDRKALPEPTIAASPREFVATRTVTEAAVAAAFAEGLRVNAVGATDDFYELGGHSLLAVRIAARLREQFGAIVSMRLVFEHPRVDALAAAIDRELGNTKRTDAPRIEPVSREQYRKSGAAYGDASDVFVLPASSAQARLFFIEELLPGRATYNVPLAVRLRGDVDVAALQVAVDGLVARHEVLRTTFASEDDATVQVIHEPRPVPIAQHDFTGAPERAWDALRSDANTPFDLRHGSVIRVSLYRVAVDEHLLLLTLHHVAADGWSVSALQRELSEGYAAAHEGRASRLPPLALQYADYALWQRAELSGRNLRKLESYWKKQLAGPLPVIELPMRGSRPALAGDRPVKRVPVRVPATLAARVDALARGERATPFMVYLAAFQLLLSRYAGTEDIIVGTPMSGRDAYELDPLVGLFLNTLALRTDLSGNPPFRALLGRVREVALGAFAHEALPFERVIDVAKPPRNEAITPIFQVMFSLQNATATASDAAEHGGLAFAGVAVERLTGALESTKFDLQLTLVPEGSSYRGTLDYDATLFDADVVERFGKHFITLLDSIAAAPDEPIASATLLDASERQQVLRSWNETSFDYPRHDDLIARIDEQVLRTPDAAAVTFAGETLSYRQLDERARKLAAYLRQQGVGPEVVVALHVQRSADMVVAMLAIHRAGGAYLPLDPGYPKDRLEFMLEDAGAAVLITQESLRDRMKAEGASVVSLDGDRAAIEAMAIEVASRAEAACDPERLAYLIYTSGSTGKPKGVGVTHRNVVNFLAGFGKTVPFGAGSTLVAVTPLSFDIAGLEIFLPLTTGGHVVVASRDEAISATALTALLNDAAATHMQATPATWRMLVDSGWTGRPGLITLCGGEALQPMLANAILSRGMEMWNLYGPTEATIWATMHHVTSSATADGDDASGRSVPIGSPMANYQAYVLDAAGQPTAIGVPGELFLGGDGIARGYHNRPELTAQRFVPDPFSADTMARLYRTGDRARWRADGVIEFLGRFDDQVKLRGFRIELGEIESVIAAQPSVQSAVVIVREDTPSDQRLVAYCVGAKSMSPSAAADASSELREHLKGVLPSYMVPNAFVWLDAWPLTPNGKLDRRALPAPDSKESGTSTAFRSPETALEEIIATVWKEVLRVPKVGTDDDFFDLGGHSLLAMQAVSRISRLFDRPVMLRVFFQHPTIRAFAASYAAEEKTPGRTEAVARALVRLRDMTPEERERRKLATQARTQTPGTRDGNE